MIRMPKSSIKGSLNNSEDYLHIDKTPTIPTRSLLLSCVTLVTILVLLHVPSIVSQPKLHRWDCVDTW
jgi:hypothetical protein